jgi:two-component system, cell cycle sensor histidine kinase and response regulator CckA
MLEERLRQTQNLKAIGTLAGGVAHDFNNLLTGILGYTWLLKQNADPTGEVYRAATVIENAAERAAELTRQLLGFARQGRHQEIELDLHALVREVTALLGRTFDRAITIRHQLQAERSLLCGDPGQLHQALLNLAINARDAMPEGGELRFATEVIPDQRVPRAEHARLQPGDHLLLEVADSGSGIAPGDLPHIFEPFFTTKAQGKGSGMGLAMVYGIVQDHAGAIEVHSQPGQGTTFRLFFPLLDEQRTLLAKDSAGRPAAGTPARGTGLVLVVDDEDLVRSMAKELLEELGYRVLTARDGIEGLEVYRESAQHVDLVLLDLVMPRMGGRECLRALQRLDPKVRVLLSSGWLGDEQERGAPLDGAAGFLPKPYQLAVLASAVARALHA